MRVSRIAEICRSMISMLDLDFVSALCVCDFPDKSRRFPRSAKPKGGKRRSLRLKDAVPFRICHKDYTRVYISHIHKREPVGVNCANWREYCVNECERARPHCTNSVTGPMRIVCELHGANCMVRIVCEFGVTVSDDGANSL